MKTLQFECRLLTDVILRQSAATVGNGSTLDFIPGNNFLGIVAAHYDEFSPEDATTVFHSGRVRFGDAHPVANEKRLVRSLHVPASMFYPKTGKASETLYIHHFYNRADDNLGLGGGPQQLKQCRRGFYAFQGDIGFPAATPTGYALKSAYDRKLRRSEDSKMYGYESLEKGTRFLLEVEVDDDGLAGRIAELLTGVHRIGRSRTAQYGLVDLHEKAFKNVTGNISSSLITVYADGRLIFLDADGEPTFRPTAKDLGVEGGEIDWERSQVRTFQYAPWSGKRMTRDADRTGIEKGSVFVINGGKVTGTGYVGSYRNEGFGRVIYCPEFLESKGENGKAVYVLRESAVAATGTKHDKTYLEGTPLLQFVAKASKREKAEVFIYSKVNEFVNKNAKNFRGERFASQWGSIRTLAVQYPTYSEIVYQLFDKQKTTKHGKDNQRNEEPDAYLTHGVATEQWKKGGRIKLLREFIEGIHEQEKEYGDIVREALVNLASEMAKKCRLSESHTSSLADDRA